MPAQQLTRAANPEVAVCILGQRSGIRKFHPVVAAKAAWMLARYLAKTSKPKRASPRGSNPTFVIFDNFVDAVPEVLAKIVVLPTQKPTGGSDPQSAVRGTEQRNDIGIGQALARRRRPRVEASAIVLH